MSIDRRAVLPLRLLLAGLFAVLVPFELLSLPGQFAAMARESPDDAWLRWPLTAATVFLVVCLQVVIASTWHLLTLVERDRIFSDGAFGWVDAIVAAIGAGWLVLLGLGAVVALRADDPAPVIIVFLLLLGTAAFGLLVVVMRALLRQATALRTDLEAVI